MPRTHNELEEVEKKRAETRMAIYRAIQDSDIEIDGHIMISYSITCKNCVRTYSVTELFDYGGCACQLDDVDVAPAFEEYRE